MMLHLQINLTVYLDLKCIRLIVWFLVGQNDLQTIVILIPGQGLIASKQSNRSNIANASEAQGEDINRRLDKRFYYLLY